MSGVWILLASRAVSLHREVCDSEGGVPIQHLQRIGDYVQEGLSEMVSGGADPFLRQLVKCTDQG
ncbi:unnamed protein product [Heligmosomoides polygyrus]|uniref:Uncharacterized protein n=1 Tax=Heligmosomoides polygyrus TaxID=6339 RepID=A0A3P7XE83_HELPZ|nr:unnamed protein product [Heligmosomoides polygyrus]